MQAIAIIPAAGRSQRMGRPKLLLPWGNTTLIEHVIAIWRASRAGRVLVVVHPDDHQLAQRAAVAGAEVVQPPVAPVEMKDSVRIALEFASRAGPRPDDAWLVAPADMPGLSVETIDALVGAYEASLVTGLAPRIWVPRHDGRRGHPVLFPWSLAAEVANLADDEGVNSLLARHEVAYLEAGHDSIHADLDTPEDYERLQQQYGV